MHYALYLTDLNVCAILSLIIGQKEENAMEKVSPQRVQWHPGFVSAMKLELKENKGDLEYTSEYGINTKPILIDLLIVKKKPDVIINNEIGDIFSKYNIIEYKSPDDELNIDDYFKVMAYACLYKSHGDNVNGIKSNEVTISFVRSSRPNELFDVLKSDHGISARKVKDGVYYLDNNPFLRLR